MKIIETSIFTKRLKTLLDEESYRKFQNELIIDPSKGKIIRGSGGLRKIRWYKSGSGKRSGVRVIYYWLNEKNIILMLLIYSKSEIDDLKPEQLSILKSLISKELK